MNKMLTKELKQYASETLSLIVANPMKHPVPTAVAAASAIVIASAIEEGFEKLASVMEGK